MSVEAAPVQAEIASATKFRFPLLSRESVVQRNPHGLAAGVLARTVAAAVAVDVRTAQHGVQQDGPPQVAGVLPISNIGGLFPSSREHGTTAISYVFTTPTSLSFASRTHLTEGYAQHLGGAPQHVVGVAGDVPGRVQQGNLVRSNLPLLELATLALIPVIVGAVFRSVIAPVLSLATAVVAYLVTVRVLGLLGTVFGLALPHELQPLIIALLLGVTTDYSVFFLTGMRRELADGQHPREAARLATARFAPIVVVAGLTVSAGTASLLVAHDRSFRVFGPGLALTVLVALVVSTSLIPALLGLLGDHAFWPSHPGPTTSPTRHRLRDRIACRVSQRRSAAAITAATLAVLGVAVLPLAQLRLDLSISGSLPAGNPVSAATDAAVTGFAPGILSPTVLVAQRAGLTRQRAGLDRLQQLIGQQPGVAGVLGPRDEPFVRNLGVFQSADGGAVRYFIVLDHDPQGATAISDLRRLQRLLPALLGRARLSDVQIGFAGDTALAAQVADKTKQDLTRIGIAAFVIELALLVLFLRAVVAPVYLMLASVLAVAAALGLTVFIFQDLLGHSGLTFYVPFATPVLLIALGSDYNVFGVGRIWAEAKDRPLRDAIRVAVPRSTRAINTAGVTLAGSFALVALVPLVPFREIAFAMVAGLLIDTFLLRLVLVPSLISLVGQVSGWPGHRLSATPPAAEPAAA